jgi:hypothetical protein
MVSAFSTELGLVLGQEKVAGKSNRHPRAVARQQDGWLRRRSEVCSTFLPSNSQQ